METLEAQAETVESAHALAAGGPVVVSPVTLRRRFNDHAVKRRLNPVDRSYTVVLSVQDAMPDEAGLMSRSTQRKTLSCSPVAPGRILAAVPPAYPQEEVHPR